MFVSLESFRLDINCKAVLCVFINVYIISSFEATLRSRIDGGVLINEGVGKIHKI